jgi:hypothetical protein
MDRLDQHKVSCPYCGVPVSVLLEPVAEGQGMIQDCGVCCRPIRLISDYEPQLGTQTLRALRNDD